MSRNNINQVQATTKNKFTNVLREIKFKRRYIYIFITIFMLISAGAIIAAKYNYTVKYNSLVINGDSYFNNEKYDRAVSCFDEAIKMKNNTGVSKKLDLAKQLNQSKNSYENGIQSMNSGDYTYAINGFKNVQNIDTSRYNTAQEKINECEQIMIKQDIQQAQSEAKAKQYKEACLMLDNALEIQPANVEVIKIKNQYTQILAKQQEDEQKKQEEAKKQDEEAAKTSNAAFRSFILSAFEATFAPYWSEEPSFVYDQVLNELPKYKSYLTSYGYSLIENGFKGERDGTGSVTYARDFLRNLLKVSLKIE